MSDASVFKGDGANPEAEINNGASTVPTDLPGEQPNADDLPPVDTAPLPETVDVAGTDKDAAVNSDGKDENTKGVAVKAQPKKKKNTNRVAVTGNYDKTELEAHVAPVLRYRIEQGLTVDVNHFVRQCIDFAINHGVKLSGYLTNLPSGQTGLFGLPPNYKPTPLDKKGYFNQ